MSQTPSNGEHEPQVFDPRYYKPESATQVDYKGKPLSEHHTHLLGQVATEPGEMPPMTCREDDFPFEYLDKKLNPGA